MVGPSPLHRTTPDPPPAPSPSSDLHLRRTRLREVGGKLHPITLQPGGPAHCDWNRQSVRSQAGDDPPQPPTDPTRSVGAGSPAALKLPSTLPSTAADVSSTASSTPTSASFASPTSSTSSSDAPSATPSAASVRSLGPLRQCAGRVGRRLASANTVSNLLFKFRVAAGRERVFPTTSLSRWHVADWQGRR